MQTEFDCPCGARVSASGSWRNDKEADLIEVCEDCDQNFVLTFSSWGADSDAPNHVPTPDGTSGEQILEPSDGGTSSPLAVDETAPDFELPGVDDEGFDTFRLSDYTKTGPVLLSFYPFDFGPVCEGQLCRFRDLEWASIYEDTDVFAISVDSTYSHRAFREANGFQFPLLTDRLATVADAFGVRYDEWENQPAVCQRAIFGINSDRMVGYRWHTDDALEEPEPNDLEDALNWAG